MRTRLRERLAALYELPGGSSRILAMEGLRGLAILLVFCVHFHALFHRFLDERSTSYAISSFLGTVGHAGVDLFFVLSGYLVYGGLIRKPTPFGGYLRRRVQRIYPTFLVVLAIYVPLSRFVGDGAKLPHGALPATKALGANLLLLPGMLPIEPIITVAWSLSYEFFYYLALPLLIAVTGMRGWAGPKRRGFFILAGAAWLGWVLATGAAHEQLALFAAGILVWEGCQGSFIGRPSHRGQIAACLAVAAALTATFLLQRHAWPVDLSGWAVKRAWALRTLALAPAFYLLVLCAIRREGWLGHALSLTPLRWLGNMSYSFYLVHGLALHAAVKLVGPVASRLGGGWVATAVLGVWAFAACWAASTILFLAVERRFSLQPPRKKIEPAQPAELRRAA